MKAIAVVLLSTLAFCAGLPSPKRLPINFGDRIVGGQNATEDCKGVAKMPPKTAKMQRDDSIRYIDFNSHACGGSIITPRSILTAAHCVFYTTAENVFVVVGSNFLDRGGVGYSAERLIHHADYNETDIKNDVGLVIVNRNIQYTPRIQPIGFNTDVIGERINAYVIGWGLTSVNGSLSNTLKFLNTTTLSNDDCSRRLGVYGSFIYESSLCILNDVGESVCNSDSGGPIVVNNKVVGLVSWGITCASGTPEVSARVSSFFQWIERNKV